MGCTPAKGPNLIFFHGSWAGAQKHALVLKKLKKKQYLDRHAVRRFRHEVKRRRKRENRRRQPAQSILSWGVSSPVIDFLRIHLKGRDFSQYSEAEQAYLIKIPKVFSIFRNPDTVLDIIYSILKASVHKALFFDHSELEEMDLGASALLDVVVMSLRREWIAKGENFVLSGILPQSAEMKDVFICTGLTRHLKIRSVAPSHKLRRAFKQFPLFEGNSKRRHEFGSSDQEIAATKLACHVDECFQLATTQYGLTKEGKRQLLKWAGEIISNAEDHSGQNEWFAMAYMRPVLASDAGTENYETGSLIGECQLAIFGFGRTLYDSLSAPSTPMETKEQIGRLVNKHKPFFNLAARYNAMDLWTLYALQDGVSRFSTRPGQTSRGKGTVEMIEAFQLLGKSLDPSKRPEMCLISGFTRIYFDDTYHLQEQEVQGGRRKIIAFNETNDLEQKPDVRHVHSLIGKLPGTLLTCKFYIDGRYLQRLTNANVQPK